MGNHLVPFDGLVLAGGRSQRMGIPKESLQNDQGRTLLEQAVSTLANALSGTVYVSRPFGYVSRSSFDLVDPVGNLGPLAGILQGLHKTSRQYLAVLAVDLPGVPSALYGQLYQTLFTGSFGAFPSCGEIRQPLAGLWAKSLAPSIEARLAKGCHSVFDLLDQVPVQWISVSNARWLFNVNRPDDWNLWQRSK